MISCTDWQLRTRADSSPQDRFVRPPAPKRLEHGSSTAVGEITAYRLGKLQQKDILQGTWLDCGCASGGYTCGLVERGVSNAIGLDLEFRVVGEASRVSTAGDRVRFVNAATEDLPFCKNCFDGVLLNEVLEHVNDELETLAQIFRVTRPGGYFALISPNRLFPFEGHGLEIGRLRLPFPVPLVPWLPDGWTRRFRAARNYWPGELHRLVEQAGFEIVAFRSLFPLFEVYRWLPAIMRRRYRRCVPSLEKTPLVNKFRISTFILARRPLQPAGN